MFDFPACVFFSGQERMGLPALTLPLSFVLEPDRVSPYAWAFRVQGEVVSACLRSVSSSHLARERWRP